MTLILPNTKQTIEQRLNSLLGFTSQPKNSRKVIKKYQITLAIVICNTLALLLAGDFHRAASAAPLFDKFTTYVKTGITTFFSTGGIGAGTVGTLLAALVTLVPWAIILLVGSIAGWQAYQGYRAYDNEDLSGMGKCVLNIIVLVGLTFAASAVTDNFVA